MSKPPAPVNDRLAIAGLLGGLLFVVLAVLAFMGGPTERGERAAAGARATVAEIDQAAANRRYACARGVERACP